MKSTPFAAVTHVGQVRTNNEDAWGCRHELWVVADGMGGHAGGEVASRLAVDTVLAGLDGATRHEATIIGAYGDAHRAVLDAADGDLAGMGTTLVLAGRDGSDVLVANVGDSRAYLLTGAGLSQLTTDDNEAELLSARGAITAEQARVHPGQYILTASLGGWNGPAPVPVVQRLAEPVGRLMLCSDGLNGELDDAQIAAGLLEGTPDQAAHRLVEAAVAAGGRDNVTVLVVDL